MYFLIENLSDAERPDLSSTSNYYHETYKGDLSHESLLEEVYSSSSFLLKLDKGWQKLETDKSIIWSKGYCTDSTFSQMVESDDYTPRNGFYLCLVYDKHEDKFQVHRDNLCGCAVFFNKRFVTNLYPLSLQVFHGEKIISSFKHGVFLQDDETYKTDFQSEEGTLSIDEVAKRLEEILIERVKGYVENNPSTNLEIQFSGGLDTAVLMAVLDHCAIPYRFIDVRGEKSVNWKKGENPLYDHLLKHFWGFKQTYLYEPSEQHVVVSGFWGDEFLMRNPLYVHWILQHYGIKILKLLDDYPDSYMTNYIRDYADKIVEKSMGFDSTEKLFQNLTEWCYRDHQVNHLNNTIMFTPYKDREILDLCFKLSKEAILTQIFDGELQKALIRSLKPEILDRVDKSKNNY